MAVFTLADFSSIMTLLGSMVGSVFDVIDGIKIVTMGALTYSMLDVIVAGLFLYAIVDFLNWLRRLGGGSENEGEVEYGPVRPRARNLKTGKVYWGNSSSGRRYKRK